MTLERMAEIDDTMVELARTIYSANSRMLDRDIIHNLDDAETIVKAMGEIVTLYDELWKEVSSLKAKLTRL